MSHVALPRSMTVNEAIRLYPLTVELFNRFGIDACCGGAVPIVEAAARDGADTGALMEELLRIIGHDE